MLRKFDGQSIVIDWLLPLRELHALVAGGLTVDTLVADKVAMRTLVQLDGDVLTFVVLDKQVTGPYQEVKENHWREVQRILGKVARQLNTVIHSVAWGAGVVSFLIIAFFTLRDAAPSGWDASAWILHVLVNLMLPIGIGAVTYVEFVRKRLAAVFLKVVRFWIGQRGRLARRGEVIAAREDPR